MYAPVICQDAKKIGDTGLHEKKILREFCVLCVSA